MPASVSNARELWKRNELIRWFVFFSIAITFTILDLITKSLTFEINTKNIIPGVLELKSVINKGIIWGLFSQGSLLFIVIPCMAIPLIILMFKYIYVFVSHETRSKLLSSANDENNPLDMTNETPIMKFSIFSAIGILTVACGLILAGAMGNLFDRIFYQGVRDFISFYIINWPIFNLADTYITIGAFLIIICMFKKPYVAKINPVSTDTDHSNKAIQF